MTTPQKLRALATVVRRNRRFNMKDFKHCIMGIGVRFNPETNTFTGKTPETFLGARRDFADKYGTTEADTWNVSLGYYHEQDYFGQWDSLSPIEQARRAADLLERYAKDYE